MSEQQRKGYTDQDRCIFQSDIAAHTSKEEAIEEALEKQHCRRLEEEASQCAKIILK
jgi:hypothetical protein